MYPMHECKIIQAARFAASAHEGQTRDDKFTPYIVHVARVAGRVATLDGVTEEMICAAYLHDVVEDCGVKLSIIRFLFGETIMKLVEELTSYTKQESYKEMMEDRPAHTRAYRKDLDRDYLSKVSIEAKRIKMIDRIDNLRDTLADADPEWALRYVRESRSLHNVALIGNHYDLDFEYMGLLEKIHSKYTDDSTTNDLQAD